MGAGRAGGFEIRVVGHFEILPVPLHRRHLGPVVAVAGMAGGFGVPAGAAVGSGTRPVPPQSGQSINSTNGFGVSMGISPARSIP
jgi:hypothetical protein